MTLIAAAREAQAAAAAEREAATAKAAAEAAAQVLAREEEVASSAWSKLINNKRSAVDAAAFFRGLSVRELRPLRLQTVGQSVTAAEKWKKLKDVKFVIGTAQEARRETNATIGAQQPFKAAGDDTAPYWKQGDESLHTEVLWKARMDVSIDPMVTEELHKWWLMSRSTFCRTPADAAKFDGLTESMYNKLMMRLYKALVAPFDPIDAGKCAREEWKADSRGASRLGRVQLSEALFEMADVWTRSVRAEEYGLFLRMLFDHITQGEPATLKPLAAIATMDVAKEANELTDSLHAARAEKEEKTRKRSDAFRRSMTRRMSISALTGMSKSDQERAAAAAAAEELGREEEAAAEAERALERVREEEEEREHEAEMAKRAAAAAAAAAEKVARREALLTAMAARRTPHGVWPNLIIPDDVMACWARKAVRPGRDHFSTPMRQAFPPPPPRTQVADRDRIAREQSFKPIAARMGHSPRALPSAAVAMQIAAWRTAPSQVASFYQSANNLRAQPPGLARPRAKSHELPRRPHSAREHRVAPPLASPRADAPRHTTHAPHEDDDAARLIKLRRKADGTHSPIVSSRKQ